MECAHFVVGGSVRTLTPSLRVPVPLHTAVKKQGRRLLLVPRATAGTTAEKTAQPVETRKLFNLSNDAESRYLTKRANDVTKHFETAVGVDDFIQKVERALWRFGFANDNSIAMVNLCRDEVTQVLKHKIDQVFGSSFSTHGLGGALTCGLTGMGAGLSHSPVCEISGKERYVFFSFPHIGIDSDGVVGNISRPGRAEMSCACGAIIKSLKDIKSDGLTCNCLKPGVHVPEDVELSILKQRLARRLVDEGQTDESVASLDLVELTKVAERTISSDLETLISHAVDTSKADYAVVTGVQIHNWATQFDGIEPNLEFVAPTSVYVVINGQRVDIDLNRMPSLPPRQMRLLASAPDAHYIESSYTDVAGSVCNKAGDSIVREIEPPYMYSSRQARRQVKQQLESFASRLGPRTAEVGHHAMSAEHDSSAAHHEASPHSLGTLTHDLHGLAPQTMATLAPENGSHTMQETEAQAVVEQQEKKAAHQKKRASSKPKAAEAAQVAAEGAEAAPKKKRASSKPKPAELSPEAVEGAVKAPRRTRKPKQPEA